MDVRKIQITGGKSYIVSLPKDWVTSAGLKAKDAVLVRPQSDMSLLIIPRPELQAATKKEGMIEVGAKKEVDTTVRLFISHYLAGYDVIRVKASGESSAFKTKIKEAIRRKLIGVEIIEETPNGIATQCLSGYSDLPLKKALERMAIVSSGMVQDAILSLHPVDQALASEVILRDDEVDRFYHFIVRQLNLAVTNRSMIEEIGLSSPRDCVGYRLAVKSVERVADHASLIARASARLPEGVAERLANEISKMRDLSLQIFNDSVRALLRSDTQLANESISRTRRVVDLEEKISGELLAQKMGSESVGSVRLVLESIRRVAEYGSDISEIAVDLSTT